MNILFLLAPLALLMAGVSLLAFLWTFKAGQYDDPQGDAMRILYDHLDDGPPRPEPSDES
jgi:cbb3-type cytochrome oxidase maturation protein